MSVPPHPPSGAGPGAHAAEVVWGSPPPPSWMPPWQPAGGPSPAGAVPAPPGQRPRTAADQPLVLVLVALASLLVGVVGGAVAATLLLFAGATDTGWGLGEDFALSEDLLGPGGDTGYGPVDQFPPTAPGALGDDPALDAHAAGCFEGDMAACETLYSESPPMSAYEEYAISCGGRVKPWTVASCMELD